MSGGRPPNMMLRPPCSDYVRYTTTSFAQTWTCARMCVRKVHEVRTLWRLPIDFTRRCAPLCSRWRARLRAAGAARHWAQTAPRQSRQRMPFRCARARLARNTPRLAPGFTPRRPRQRRARRRARRSPATAVHAVRPRRPGHQGLGRLRLGLLDKHEHGMRLGLLRGRRIQPVRAVRRRP